MVFKNYYKILGLTKNTKSTQDEIKSAYREQAKKYHPDVNVNNRAAEERFKDINEAYRILSDMTQKRKYDRSWHTYIGRKMQKESSKDIKVNDIVSMFFGGSISKKEEVEEPLKGENIETEISISLKEAFDGTKKNLSYISKADGKKDVVEVEIPRGVKQAQVIRVEGKGKQGKNGGKNGDLLVKINIQNTTTCKLKGNDILVNLYVTPWDAVLGGKMHVQSIDGEVSILIPKGTQSGNKIKIPSKGYHINENERGNLIVETQVVVPKKVSEEEKNLFMKLKEISNFNPNNNIVNIK